MADHYRKGDTVRWAWGAHQATGTIDQRFERRVQRTIKGSRIVKNGTKANPAYLIEQEDGDRVLKRGSELAKD